MSGAQLVFVPLYLFPNMIHSLLVYARARSFGHGSMSSCSQKNDNHILLVVHAGHSHTQRNMKTVRSLVHGCNTL